MSFPRTELAARPLNTQELAASFIVNVLGFDDKWKDFSRAVTLVTDTESIMGERKPAATLHSPVARDRQYVSEDARKQLRLQILRDLTHKKRLEDDNKLQLGKGGAKPTTDIRAEKRAYIITGLPASGKSTVAGKICDAKGAYIIDSDYAKRKLPEFDRSYGANLVHEESHLITFGDANSPSKDSLWEYCTGKGLNIVIPKIGYSHGSLEEMATELAQKGYETHLTLVSVDRAEATKRALKRFVATKRYVPLSLIFDGYGNDPILSYYRTRGNKCWASTGKISNSRLDLPPLQVFASHSDNPATLYQPN